MTDEEAIKDLINLKRYCTNMANPLTCKDESNVWERDIEALELAIKALQKDIPMPPKRDKIPRCGMGERYYDWICSTCGTFLAYEPNVEGIPNRCQACGQLIYKGAEE